ncbi:MAG: hypothetical protein EOO26_14440 [Comamonadaceae bacterium]|nr:MAG: hypothetical protein EOO26_14440 [Comamonadaceae bacterium]
MKADDYAKTYSRHRSSRRAARKQRRNRIVAVLLGVVMLAAAALLYSWVSEPEPSPMARQTTPAIARPVERTAALPPLSLPADDAPHGSGMEWWYYNGILNGPNNDRYAFHVAVFVANGLVKHTVMHTALTDLQTGKRYARQNRTGGMPAKGTANGFDFGQDGWQVASANGTHTLKAALDNASITLQMKDANEPIAHRAAGSATPGLLDFGSAGISYYYSRPRIATEGAISIGGKPPVKVTGEVWFDHQWGDFDVTQLGWNWFALHLADGSDVMLYELFDRDGRSVLTAGTVSDAKGGTLPLKASDIVLTPQKRWTSPHTGVDYPVEWQVKLPSGTFEVKPFIADSEFDSRETTRNIYWEGAVRVAGSQAGEGFVELSGYERLKAPAATAAK